MNSRDIIAVYTPAELAQALGISMPKVYELCRTSGFPSYRIGRRWFIDPHGLDLFFKEQKSKKN